MESNEYYYGQLCQGPKLNYCWHAEYNKSKTNQFHDFVQLLQILDGISYKNVIYWDVIWFLTSAYGLLFTSGDGNYE